MDNLAIGLSTQVTLHFSLALEDGSVVDSNFEGEPATFSVGDGSMLPGFEQVLFGLKAGDDKTFVILPEQGFGQHNPANVQIVARSQFPPELTPERGLMLSFADAQQNEMPGVISDFDEETVTIDFNHPLAGRDIQFHVRILDVVPAVTH